MSYRDDMIPQENNRDITDDLRDRIKELEQQLDMCKSRICWTVEDNAKKAIEIEDQQKEIQRLQEGYDDAVAQNGAMKVEIQRLNQQIDSAHGIMREQTRKIYSLQQQVKELENNGK